ncbi:MAG: metallophosphoesterase [Chloroflexota bacterium]|nr:metallophosphoesterase [Chloroflexota bacterium]
MPTLIHLSDLHFGPGFLSHLGDLVLKEIETLNPDAVVVSGDFTMRARHTEYQAAREYLNKIARPTLTIPGNHDQPLLSPVERLVSPFARYQKYIRAETDTTLAAGGFFIAGLNDNRRILPGGFWSSGQRAWLATQMQGAPRGAGKVVVTHHQLMGDGRARPAGFWFPSRTLALLARHGVEIVLNGHTHVPSAAQSPEGIVIARAGTATSSRTRHGNINAYNVIAVDEKQISVFVREYDERSDAFVAARAYTFPRPSREI